MFVVGMLGAAWATVIVGGEARARARLWYTSADKCGLQESPVAEADLQVSNPIRQSIHHQHSRARMLSSRIIQ